MMTSAPLAQPEDFKLLLREGIAKLCPPGIVTKEYNSLQFVTAKGEPGTQGSYLMVGLSILSHTHLRLRDILLSQPKVVHESQIHTLPWLAPPFLTPTTPDVIEIDTSGPAHPRRDRQLPQGEISAPRSTRQKDRGGQVDHHLSDHRAVGRIRPQICGLGGQLHPSHLHRRFDPRRRHPSLTI